MEFILTIWMVFSGVFVLAICSAAARPIPQPVGANVEERGLSSYNTDLEVSRVNKLHPVFWLAIVLAFVATSCASSANHPVRTPSGGQIKGATLLMQH